MSDLRLADEIIKAATYISIHEDTDVEVVSADGSCSFYIKGEEIAPVSMAAAMPQMQAGQSASYLDMTPTTISLGRWHEEAEQFVASRSLSPQKFLEFYRLALNSGRR
jgi:hypothetical protein